MPYAGRGIFARRAGKRKLPSQITVNRAGLCRCKRKICPETGDIVPTRGRAKKGSRSVSGKPAKTGPKPFVETRHLYYGATYLLNEFANELGLAADLRQCFPETPKDSLPIEIFTYHFLR